MQSKYVDANFVPKPPYNGRNVRAFWDIENCGIPTGYDATTVHAAITAWLRGKGYRGNVKITGVAANIERVGQEKDEELYQNRVRITYMDSEEKQISDHELDRQIAEWDMGNNLPANLMLISGDGGFQQRLLNMAHRHNVMIASIPGSHSPKLDNVGSTKFNWRNILVPPTETHPAL